MKKILYFILKILAQTVVNKYQPKVIGITGSVGKTSAKKAIFCVLKNKFRVKQSTKNYNNEIGLPLTVLLWEHSPGKNIFKWFGLFIHALTLIFAREEKYPEILILEMGADRPGDIKYLTSIAKPSIAVITAIGQSHLEFFGTIENVLKEKISILDSLNKDGLGIINSDDPLLRRTIGQIKTRLKTFGQNEDSDVRVLNVHLATRENQYGTSFKLSYRGAEVPMFIPEALGWQHAQAAAAGCAVGLSLGLNLIEIGEQLKEYVAEHGRSKLIVGIKNSWIIDDTYNASPQSAAAVLNILHDMPINGRKIAVFGDMLELGSLSEEGHRKVGQQIVELNIDYLFVIGERSRDIARGAKEDGMIEDKIYHFAFTKEAGLFLQDRIKEDDVILVKGSRGSKMEQVVYEIMANPWESKEVLVGPVDK